MGGMRYEARGMGNRAALGQRLWGTFLEALRIELGRFRWVLFTTHTFAAGEGGQSQNPVAVAATSPEELGPRWTWRKRPSQSDPASA